MPTTVAADRSTSYTLDEMFRWPDYAAGERGQADAPDPVPFAAVVLAHLEDHSDDTTFSINEEDSYQAVLDVTITDDPATDRVRREHRYAIKEDGRFMSRVTVTSPVPVDDAYEKGRHRKMTEDRFDTLYDRAKTVSDAAAVMVPTPQGVSPAAIADGRGGI
ncbi:MAG: hypothetical protein SVW02_02190 [Candidatus Nanohaloarchaea archaeon]|nr:hypothetical protein [Candidatus Nanohaloarchaea archaeon]